MEVGNGTKLPDREDHWTYTLALDGLLLLNLPGTNSNANYSHCYRRVPFCLRFSQKKVNIFLWRFLLDTLPTRWNLSVKGIDISSIICHVCCNGIEIRDHLFYGYGVAVDHWAKVRIWLGCNMPSFNSWDSFLSWIEGFQISSSNKERIIAVVVTLLWVLWHFRNGIVYNDSICNRSSIFDIFRLYSFCWLKNRGHLVSNRNLWQSMLLSFL
ncbi:uncharacterized protein [Rutidosis leptorrhynchoides]|uniref:uncharacterized protein n=1 Tax=Rutidosis leptorrhynchoides TaxID=125765 RepID=UPI003A98D109